MSTMEKIKAQCPGCGTEHKVPASAVGKTLTCPACGADLPIGGGAAPDNVDAPEAPMPRPPTSFFDKAEVQRATFKEEEPEKPQYDKPEWEPEPEPKGQYDKPEWEPEAAPVPPPPGPPPELMQDTGPPPDFFKLLNKAFLYPLSTPASILFVVVMSIFIGIVSLPFAFGWIMWPARVILWGYTFVYGWRILSESAMGNDKAPDVPDVSNAQELFMDFVRFTCASIFAYAPAILLALSPMFGIGITAEFYFTPLFWILLIVFGLFGTLYYPMSLMLMGFGSFWAPLNYPFAIQAIFRMPGHYIVTALFFIGTALGVGSFEYFIRQNLGTGMFSLGASIAVFPIKFAEIYMICMQLRALGILYYCNKEKIGLFDE